MCSCYYLPHTSDGGHRPVEGNYVLLKLWCTIPNYIWGGKTCAPPDTYKCRHGYLHGWSTTEKWWTLKTFLGCIRHKYASSNTGLTGYSMLHAMNVSSGDSPVHTTQRDGAWILVSGPLPGRSVQVPDLHKSAERRLLGSVLAALLHGRAYQMHAMMWILSHPR